MIQTIYVIAEQNNKNELKWNVIYHIGIYVMYRK